jgi:hypothetical protein
MAMIAAYGKNRPTNTHRMVSDGENVSAAQTGNCKGLSRQLKQSMHDAFRTIRGSGRVWTNDEPTSSPHPGGGGSRFSARYI